MLRKFEVAYTSLDYWTAENDFDGLFEVVAESREEAVEKLLSEFADPEWVRVDWVSDHGPVED